MDCMASNAATKNGLVLSSLPAASGILVRSPRATTECEFGLASKPRSQNRLEPRSQMQGLQDDALTAPQTEDPDRARRIKRDGVLDQVKAKPLRGDPKGSALT